MEKTGEIIAKNLRRRSSVEDLAHSGVMIGDANKVAPSLQAASHKLERALIEDKIEKGLRRHSRYVALKLLRAARTILRVNFWSLHDIPLKISSNCASIIELEGCIK